MTPSPAGLWVLAKVALTESHARQADTYAPDLLLPLCA